MDVINGQRGRRVTPDMFKGIGQTRRKHTMPARSASRNPNRFQGSGAFLPPVTTPRRVSTLPTARGAEETKDNMGESQKGFACLSTVYLLPDSPSVPKEELETAERIPGHQNTRSGLDFWTYQFNALKNLHLEAESDKTTSSFFKLCIAMRGRTQAWLMIRLPALINYFSFVLRPLYARFRYASIRILTLFTPSAWSHYRATHLNQSLNNVPRYKLQLNVAPTGRGNNFLR